MVNIKNTPQHSGTGEQKVNTCVENFQTQKEISVNGTKVVLKSDNLVRYTEQRKRADRKILKLKEECSIYSPCDKNSNEMSLIFDRTT